MNEVEKNLFLNFVIRALDVQFALKISAAEGATNYEDEVVTQRTIWNTVDLRDHGYVNNQG